jgi:hypothetical protein
MPSRVRVVAACLSCETVQSDGSPGTKRQMHRRFGMMMPIAAEAM